MGRYPYCSVLNSKNPILKITLPAPTSSTAPSLLLPIRSRAGNEKYIEGKRVLILKLIFTTYTFRCFSFNRFRRFGCCSTWARLCVYAQWHDGEGSFLPTEFGPGLSLLPFARWLEKQCVQHPNLEILRHSTPPLPISNSRSRTPGLELHQIALSLVHNL